MDTLKGQREEASPYQQYVQVLTKISFSQTEQYIVVFGLKDVLHVVSTTTQRDGS
jgi:hypothetical protein